MSSERGAQKDVSVVKMVEGFQGVILRRDSVETEVKIYHTLIRPAAVYGSKCWPMEKKR